VVRTADQPDAAGHDRVPADALRHPEPQPLKLAADTLAHMTNRPLADYEPPVTEETTMHDLTQRLLALPYADRTVGDR